MTAVEVIFNQSEAPARARGSKCRMTLAGTFIQHDQLVRIHIHL